MYHVYEVASTYVDSIYMFTYEHWWSSDFHSLEQLIDVGLHDPAKSFFEEDLTSLEDIISLNPDETLIHLCSVESLDDIEQHYPELFI